MKNNQTDKIIKLPNDVINRIAAGEVIERPAAVVKELVENSLDADADKIEVNVEEGGKTFISVNDNGVGISEKDLLMALEAHATSKLSDFKNISDINSFGFRGEALASISSVSKVTISSKKHDADRAFKLESKFGTAGEIKPCVFADGTKIEVVGLFENIPARSKFLKSKSTEIAYISNELSKIALANPNISLSLYHGSRKVFILDKADNLKQRIQQLYPKQLYDDLLASNHFEKDLKIEGYISSPDIKKSNSKSVHIFLNKRPIRDKGIMNAILMSYREYMPSGKYPAVFLFLTLPTDEFDVNVHPQKLEVRFFRHEKIFARFRNLIRTTLNNAKMPIVNLQDMLDQVQSRAAARKDSSNTVIDFDDEEIDRYSRHEPQIPLQLSADKLTHQKHLSFEPAIKSDDIQLLRPKKIEFVSSEPPEEPDNSDKYDFSKRKLNTCDTSEQNEFQLRPDIFVSPLFEKNDKIYTDEILDVYQIKNSYILAEYKDRIEFYDQHALHERILFENLRKKFENKNIEKQLLLTPEILDLDTYETSLMHDFSDIVNKIGFDIKFNEKDEFWEVYAVPMLLSKRFKVKEILENTLGSIISDDVKPDFVKVTWLILATIACKAAIKAGDPLKREEMIALIYQSKTVDTTYACPHGRPTSIMIPLSKLDKYFDR